MFRDLVMAAAGLVWAAILVLVGARFVALLHGSDRSSDLIEALYRRSEVFVQPFFDNLGLSNKALIDTGAVYEPASLIALLAYFFAGALVLGILRARIFGVYRHDYAL
ncbi:MAG TPA: hypothetical protein VJB57_12430 [Dehalococcoidia bacterium]|nr:hypothetical protein [Dehalococcoidia bacterium]